MLAIWLALDIVFNIPDPTNTWKIYWVGWWMCNGPRNINMPNCVKSYLEPGEVVACIFTPIVTIVVLWEAGKYALERLRQVRPREVWEKITGSVSTLSLKYCSCCPCYRMKTPVNKV
jgi:hypothetical protein